MKATPTYQKIERRKIYCSSRRHTGVLFLKVPQALDRLCGVDTNMQTEVADEANTHSSVI